MINELEGWNLSIRTSLLPKDTNQHGTIFGGVILSHIDMAGAIEAKRFCEQEVVTVAVKEVVFKEPVFVGDMISFYTRIIETGRTSMTIEVCVIALRDDKEHNSHILTNAQITFVSISKDRTPEPIRIRSSKHDPPAFAPEYLARKLTRDD